MIAVVETHKPSAKYFSALQPPLVQHFELMATAPSGVAKLRNLILTLAVQGKLVPQEPTDEPASELLRKIRTEKNLSIGGAKNKWGESPVEILEEDLPYRLPMAWEWIRNQNLFSLRKGKNPKVLSETPIGRPYLDIEALDRHQVRRFSEDATALTCSADDILVVCDGSRSGLILQGKDGIVGSTLAVIDCSKLVQPYLRLIFRAGFQRYNSGVKGAAIPHLDTKTVLNEVTGLPPFAEQSRIVTRVEELMRLCDALEAKSQLEAAQHAQLVQTLLSAMTASTTAEELADNWQRVATHFDLLLDRPEAIDALEQSILQMAVRGLLSPQDLNDEPAENFVRRVNVDRKIRRAQESRQVLASTEEGQLPKGWCVTNIGCISECLDYVRRPIKKSDREATVGTVPYFGANGQVGWIDDYLFDEDLVLVVEDETFIGRTKPFSYIVRGKSWVNNHAHVLRPLGGMTVEYLNLCLERYDFIPLTSGTTNRRKLTKAGLLDAVVFIAPLAEQTRIVARVEALRRLCADLRQRLAARQTTQAHLAEALIDEVV